MWPENNAKRLKHKIDGKMKKSRFIVISVIVTTFIFSSCSRKLDVCECLSFKNAIMDQYLLSEKDRQEKEEGCQWIYEEYSSVELVQKWAECNNNEVKKMQKDLNADQQSEQVTIEKSDEQNISPPESQKEESVYYPITNTGDFDTQSVSLHYWPNPDGNKPYAQIKFTNGVTFSLMPNCEGDYNWCIRTSENIEIGFLKIEPDSEGEAIFLDVRRNQNSTDYSYYLDKMVGTFRLLK